MYPPPVGDLRLGMYEFRLPCSTYGLWPPLERTLTCSVSRTTMSYWLFKDSDPNAQALSIFTVHNGVSNVAERKPTIYELANGIKSKDFIMLAFPSLGLCSTASASATPRT